MRLFDPKKFDDLNPDDTLNMQITFDNQESLQNNFYNTEFKILKGTLKSLCDDVVMKINNAVVIDE